MFEAPETWEPEILSTPCCQTAIDAPNQRYQKFSQIQEATRL